MEPEVWIPELRRESSRYRQPPPSSSAGRYKKAGHLASATLCVCLSSCSCDVTIVSVSVDKMAPGLLPLVVIATALCSGAAMLVPEHEEDGHLTPKDG